jgi:hypothetical protein
MAATANLVRNGHLGQKVRSVGLTWTVTLYLIIEVQILEEAFFFRRGYLYEVRKSQMKKEEKGRKPEQKMSHC